MCRSPPVNLRSVPRLRQALRQHVEVLRETAGKTKNQIWRLALHRAFLCSDVCHRPSAAPVVGGVAFTPIVPEQVLEAMGKLRSRHLMWRSTNVHFVETVAGTESEEDGVDEGGLTAEAQ